LDEFSNLANQAGVPLDKMPLFLTVTGRALMQGEPEAMERLAQTLIDNGYQFKGQVSDGMYSEEDLHEAVKVATASALEDFDGEAATEKALNAVRSRRQSGDGVEPQKPTQRDQQQPPQGGGRQQDQAHYAVKPETRQAIVNLSAAIIREHGQNAQRINDALAATIREGRLPENQADWIIVLEAIRDREVATIRAEQAKTVKKPPATTPTSQRTRKPSTSDPFADLDAEVGLV
jgi:hypothetical protein